MTKESRSNIKILLGVLLLTWGSDLPTARSAPKPSLTTQQGMVAADSPIASRVGAEILQAGGDAVDAAVATTLALGVVHPFASGIGGGGFAIVHRSDGASLVLDFREVAPANATKDMFLNPDGTVIPNASTLGARAVGVPGELAGLAALHRRYGKLSWAQVMAPAIRLARDGFVVSEMLHYKLKASLANLQSTPIAQDVVDKDGRIHKPGSTMRSPALAKTLETISKDGAEVFYEGPLAQTIVASIRGGGGLITMADFRAYKVKTRPVLRAEMNGYSILTMPPPSSGGLVIIQVLRALDGINLRALGHNSSAYLHRLTETFKHAFADRARAMGDPDFYPIRYEDFIGPETIARVKSSFNPRQTHPPHRYGAPQHNGSDGGTSHLSVVDAKGNAVALTTTINTGFGSHFIAGSTGIILNNEMDDFVARPGVPNAFGLIGNEANAIAPGKRPLSSMSPTIILKDNGPRYVLGGSGGPTIITGTLQTLLNMMVFQFSPRAAVDAPKVHHQWMPQILFAEPELPGTTITELKALGHKVERRGRFGAVQAIWSTKGTQIGASDPSKGGKPAGVDSEGRIQQMD